MPSVDADHDADPEVAADHPPQPRLDDGRRALLATGVTAIALSAGYLLLARSGTDLSAQVARADFAKEHGFAPIDFRWYGGTEQFGYSLLSPLAMAMLGVRLAGALAAVVSSLTFTALLLQGRVRRPLLGGVVGSVWITCNLVSGRITYAIGVAFGLAALLVLRRANPKQRCALAATLAFLASASSPVAGLFVGLVGATLILIGRRLDGWSLGVAAAVPMVLVAGLFGQGGHMVIDDSAMAQAFVLGAAALVVVPHRLVQLAAGIYLVGMVATWLLHTPVGLNATRLAVMFVVPVLLATLQWRAQYIALLAVALTVWQPPIVLDDFTRRGDVAATRAYFQPLTDKLRELRPTGRVEVPQTEDSWESVYVADVAPLARGWLRQVDVRYNDVFYYDKLSQQSYRRWLHDNAVQYVAVSDSSWGWAGEDEARIVREGLPYLREVWKSAHWTLYEVVDATPIITPPGQMVEMDADGLSVKVDERAEVTLRIRFSRWLTVDRAGACLRPSGEWTTLEVGIPGTYRIGSQLQFGQESRCRT